jgi:hypothetical protein
MDRQQGWHMAVIKPKEIDDFSVLSDTISITSGAYDTSTITSIDLTNAVGATGTSYTWNGLATSIGTSALDWGNLTVGTSIGQSGVMELRGEDADIKVNGRSLMNAITALEERLNVLVPNPELEKEWDELRELGERYRELEKKCKEKGEMWKKLKQMPPPKVD